MARTRKINKVLQSRPTIEGAGVHLNRVFGFSELPLFDPFLLLDDFRSDNPDHFRKGFPWHPHRGIETITYVLQGDVEHGDSLGNSGVIGSGDVQWMTAGSGVIHQELPRGDQHGRMYGFQLWANLPASHKMMDPRYRTITSSQIPRVQLENDVVIKIIAGRVAGVDGPVQDIVISPQYLDVSIPPRTQYSHPVQEGHTVLAYIIDGQGIFCRENKPFSYEVQEGNHYTSHKRTTVENTMAILFENGEEIFVATHDDPVRFLLISGKPLGEPVAWYGPIVMNSNEELETAFDEYEKGTFIKVPG